MEEVCFTVPWEFSSLCAEGTEFPGCLPVGRVQPSTLGSSRLWLLQWTDFTKSRKALLVSDELTRYLIFNKVKRDTSVKNLSVFLFWKKHHNFLFFFFLNVPLVSKETVMHYLNSLSLLLEYYSHLLGKMLIFRFLLFWILNLSIQIFLNFYEIIPYIYF